MIRIPPEIAPRVALALMALALIALLLAGRERAQANPAPSSAAQPARSQAAPEAEGLRFATRLEAPAPAPLESASVIGTDEPTPSTRPRRAPRAPAAPPLPFSYLGRMIDGERTLVFVGRGDDHYTAAAGLTIDETYRVEKVTKNAVTFVFLPSGTRQELALPSFNE
jgi:hypothetical protein